MHAMAHLVLGFQFRVELTQDVLQRLPCHIGQHIQTTSAMHTHKIQCTYLRLLVSDRHYTEPHLQV